MPCICHFHASSNPNISLLLGSNLERFFVAVTVLRKKKKQNTLSIRFYSFICFFDHKLGIR